MDLNRDGKNDFKKDTSAQMSEQHPEPYYFLPGKGEMGALVRAFDWDQTSIGPVERWPASLRTVLGFVMQSKAPMILWWGDDLIQFYNDAYRPSLGEAGKHPVALGQKAEECWREAWPALSQDVDAVKAGKATWNVDKLIPIVRNGRMQEVYWTYGFTPVRDESGAVKGILIIATETSQQVLNKRRMEESERTLQSLVLQAPVGICILKGESVVRTELVNDIILELVGKPREVMESLPVWEAVPHLRDKYEAILDDVIKTGIPYKGFEHNFTVVRQGKERMLYIDILLEPLKLLQDPEEKKIMVLAMDVTDQVRARQKVEELVAERTKELRESNQKLHHLNEELAQFAYIASHDLQEPARKIFTFTDMLQGHLGEADERTVNLLNKIGNAGSRMLMLVRDVLAFSMVAKEKHSFERVDLNQILAETRTDFELMIEKKNAEIISSSLPVVYANKVQMGQLFGNLISNALKFTRKNIRPVINISCSQVAGQYARDQTGVKPVGDYYWISFRDNGIGFEERHARKIFEIFQRLHSKAEYEGTGIGLAICKRIAQNHQGEIYAEGQEGRGASFHVLLPVPAFYRHQK